MFEIGFGGVELYDEQIVIATQKADFGGGLGMV